MLKHKTKINGWEVQMKAYGPAHEPRTTCNRMELLAIYYGLQKVPDGASVQVITDSKLCANSLSRWVYSWMENGWMTKEGQPVKNRELLEAILEETRRLGAITYKHVPRNSSQEMAWADAKSKLGKEMTEIKVVDLAPKCAGVS